MNIHTLIHKIISQPPPPQKKGNIMEVGYEFTEKNKLEILLNYQGDSCREGVWGEGGGEGEGGEEVVGLEVRMKCLSKGSVDIVSVVEVFFFFFFFLFIFI